MGVVTTILAGLGGLLVALWLFAWFTQRRLGRQGLEAMTQPFGVGPLTEPLPERLVAVRRTFESLGLPATGERVVDVPGFGTRVAQILHLADGATVLAEAVCGFADRHPDPLLSFSTALSGHRGLLVTETHRSFPAPLEELVQNLPGAAPADALAEHRRAVALLRDRGVVIDQLGDVATETVWMHELSGRPFRDDPDRAVAEFLDNIRHERQVGVGSLAQQVDVHDRIAHLLTLQQGG